MNEAVVGGATSFNIKGSRGAMLVIATRKDTAPR